VAYFLALQHHYSIMKITAISGSIRTKSSNTTLLKAMANLLAPEIEFILYTGIADLPHFNPDLPAEQFNSLSTFRAYLASSDVIIICTPEYAHGIPGVLKNALDWVVGSGELSGKAVAAISASPTFGGGEKALASLVQTLTIMDAKINENTTLAIPFIRTKINEEGKFLNPALQESLLTLLNHLLQ
jgi:NAD(P)H-dependent FMN reductase